MIKRVLYIPLLILTLAACQFNNSSNDAVVVPTQANPDAIRTQNASTPPPAGFETVAYNPIDFNRDQLPNSYYEVTVNFEGQFTETGEEATGSLIMRVWEDGVLRRRRVILNFLGSEAISGGVMNLEAVRFENDFYLLDSNGICTQNNDAAREIATLTADRIVGGMTLALPTGVAEDVNGYTGYQYLFDAQDLIINIFATAPSAVDVVGGEVWALPEYNVAGRFGVSLNIHNAQILFGTQPVTGTLRYQYDLFDIGEAEGISLPNGC